MVKHKAPTEVTIASTTEESDLHLLVKRYWPAAAGIALASSAAIIFYQWRGQQETSSALDSWLRLDQDVKLSEGLNPPPAKVLAELADEIADTPAGPWAKAIEIGKRVSEEDTEGTRRALVDLKSQWEGHLLATQPLFPRPSGEGPARALADHVDAQMTALAAWEEAHPSLFSNPELPEGAPRVRINTSLGSIVVGLYEDLAPEHAANFLKLAQEGFYDGVLFHRVIQDMMVQAGDPNSRDENAKSTLR